MSSLLKASAALLAFMAGLACANAQNVQQLPWQERDRADMQPLEYEYQREADVMWSKTVWRTIDTRQKMNLPFVHPGNSLIEVLHEAAKKGELTVYDPAELNADKFVKPMTTAEVSAIGYRKDTMLVVDPMNPDREVEVPIEEPFRWDRVTKYRIKEVWFFDTKTSTMQVRIIGLAPVMEDYDAAGNYRGDMTMYWVYYPAARNILMKNEVYNPQNDSQHFSWDDLFQMRLFASYIYKESNVFDRTIAEYATGIDAQLENERIKQDIFEKEHDLWNY